MISIESSGSWDKTISFLERVPKVNVRAVLESCGQDGVRALEGATPQDSGVAANSWSYEVRQDRGGYSIIWNNSDIENGFPVAIMLQYGHGTGSGGYVQGRDYINPAMKPIFDKIAERVWKAVTQG